MNILIHVFRIVVLIAISNSAFAAERAFEGAHLELDIESVDNNPSGDAASSAGLGAGMTATFPLGWYFGAALEGEYMRTRMRTGELFGNAGTTRPDCSFDSLGGEASLLFRLPRYFRLSAGYSTVDLTADCTGDSVFTDAGRGRGEVDALHFAAEAYLGNFTLGVEQTQTSLRNDEDLQSTTIAASWYPLESLKLQLSGNDLYDAQTYRLMVEHQMEMLGDGFGIRVAFSTSDLEPRSRTFELGFSYYFGRKIPLLSRDRAWR